MMLIIATAAFSAGPPETSQLVGAIRWDAWFGAPAAPHEGIIGRAVTAALEPPKWHYRLPFFATIQQDGSIVVDGDSAAAMAQENKLAAQHGIDYFAFCTYPIGCSNYDPNSTACTDAQCCADNYKLSYALENYLASPGPLDTAKPRFSLILQAQSWYPVANHGGNETLEQEAARYAGYFALDSYQKVAGAKRPLVFLLGGTPATPQLVEALSLLRQASVAAGAGAPLFVMMANSPTPKQLARLVNNSLALGAEALSQYNLVGNRTAAGYPYAANMRFEREWWRQAQEASSTGTGTGGLGLVVPVSAGWDSRPRQERTMPWGDVGNKRCVAELGHECWLEDPSMPELTQQVENALRLESDLGILISAWNENDEGHWIVPSLKGGAAKLQAVAAAVHAQKRRRESYWQQFKSDDDNDEGAAAAVVAAVSPPQRPDVGAIYFGDWAPDPWMEAMHGANWTEWVLPLNAQPRYPGHLQPNLPLETAGWGPAHPESDPANMQIKIDAAADHSIDFFMFDWYWYAETGAAPPASAKPFPTGFPKTSSGGPFLEAALNAFVRAPNSRRLKFCLHFCNQDWVDVHPAKRGFHATGRPFDAEAAGGSVAPPLIRDELMMFDGWMTQQVYHAAFDHVASKFFTLDNYYTLPTRQADGSVKQCALFAFYILPNMLSSMGEAATIESLQYLRNATQAHAGKCLHIQLMSPQPSLYPLIPKLGVDSHTDYCWMKLRMARQFPETAYDAIMANVSAKWDEREGELHNISVPYVPSVSTGWDSSPRTLIHDPFEDAGYPWGPSFHAEPRQFGEAMRLAKAWSQKRCTGPASAAGGSGGGGTGCPPVLINAWNEWSEGAYLEPDQRYGFQKLQQINQTFAR